MIKYVETNARKCGIPPQVAEQLKTGHKNTAKMQKNVCSVAQQSADARSGRSEPQRGARLLACVARSARPSSATAAARSTR